MNYYDIPTYLRKEWERGAIDALVKGIAIKDLSHGVQQAYMNILEKNNLTFKN